MSLDLAVLGVLADGELHGYDVKKQIAELPGAPLRTSFGALYPALSRLEGKGLVKVAEANEGRSRSPLVPMPASLSGEAAIFGSRKNRSTRGGRRKKVYAISDAGREELTRLLLDDVTDDRAFPLQVAFSSQLPRAERLRLFERRRAHLAERAARPTEPEGLDHYRHALFLRHGNALAADLAWLDQLIDHERNATPDQELPTTASAQENLSS